MALKFDFSKLRTAVQSFLSATDVNGTELTAGEEAVFVPLMRYGRIVEHVLADITLTNEDSGKLLVVNPTAETTITLPAIGNVGFCVDIVITEGIAATDGSMGQVVNVDLGSGANLINIGQVHEVDGAAGNFAVANDDFFVFTAASTPGDRVSCVSTGTQWIVQAYVKDLSDSDFSANATTIA